MSFAIRLIFFFFTVTATTFLISQTNNLVPNPSFEEYNALPYDVAMGKECISIWKFPNIIGGGEYYHSRSTSKLSRTEKNHFGSQTPHSGNAYAGVCISKNVREFLQVELIYPLIKSEMYEIKLYISCADKLYLSKVNEFNIIFSKNSFRIHGSDFLLNAPKLKFKSATKYENKTEWVELSMIYKADGTEKWITFGSFPYIENKVEYGKIIGMSKYAHYYIDDVSIIALNEDSSATITYTTVQEETEEKIEFDSGKSFVLDNIQFETGKSTLLPESYVDLDQLVFYLKEHPDKKLKVLGYTDNIGSAAGNIELSYNRAKTVKLYLISNKEIKESRVLIEGKGDTIPISSNKTEEGRKSNRRVEFSFY